MVYYQEISQGMLHHVLKLLMVNLLFEDPICHPCVEHGELFKRGCTKWLVRAHDFENGEYRSSPPNQYSPLGKIILFEQNVRWIFWGMNFTEKFTPNTPKSGIYLAEG